MWRIKAFRTSISNLIYWFKIIWRDRQYDHNYLETMLLAKYKRMYKCLSSDKYLQAVDQDEYCQALRICINILERRKVDWYCDIWHLRAGQFMVFKWEDCEIKDHKRLNIVKDSVKIDPNYENPMKYTNIVYERDWKVYCKLIEKYQNHWWN